MRLPLRGARPVHTTATVDQGGLAGHQRWVELQLLGLAGLVGGVALLVVQLAQHQPVTVSTALDVALFSGLFVLAHLAIRWLAPGADPLILPCVAVLNGLGVVLIHRLDLAAASSAASRGDPAPPDDAAHQVIWTALGLVLFGAVLMAVRDHRILARYGYTSGVTGLVLLVTPALLPARYSEVNGGKNWILLHGFSIQPGELAKILLIVFSAALLVAKRDLFTTAGRRVLGVDLPRARDLAPLVAAWGVSIGVLVFDKDLGFALLIFGTVLVMLYVATNQVSWLLAGTVLFVGGCVVAYHLFNHVRVRFDTWADPFSTYSTTGYQVSQSLFGLGTGGIGGDGLGAGQPDLVPFAKTDFIIATAGEELGLAGLAAILLVYLFLVLRGFRVALSTRDTFGKLLAAGLAFTLGWQVFVVVGGVTKLLPLTGLTTPFLSYGGSSLLANYVVVALLIRISHSTHQPGTPRPTPPTPIADAPTQLVTRH